MERHVLRERTSSCPIPSSVSPLQAETPLIGSVSLARLSILCTLSKSYRVVLITWSPSGYTPVGPGCHDALLSPCLLITTWQLVKAHGVIRNEPKIHVICYITIYLFCKLHQLLFFHAPRVIKIGFKMNIYIYIYIYIYSFNKERNIIAGSVASVGLSTFLLFFIVKRDVALRTCQRRWRIGKSGERGSGLSVLAARHDDDDLFSIAWTDSTDLFNSFSTTSPFNHHTWYVIQTKPSFQTKLIDGSFAGQLTLIYPHP